jgi:hypothetical protein
MLRIRTTLAFVGACSALAALPRPTPATGTIDMTGATVEAGSAPTPGVVTIDPSAPTVDPPDLPSNDALGSLGAMPGSLPAFPGGGTGALGPITFGVVPNNLAGGTYQYSSYMVTPGATVTYGGPVTIMTTGDVTIDGGLVTTTAAASPITFICGGNFRITSHTGLFATGISTTGANSPVSVDVAGTLSTTSADGSGSLITAQGPVTMLSHSATSLLALQNIVVVSAIGGDAVVQSAQGVSLISSSVQATNGSATAQAFGGPVVMTTGSVLATNNALVEAAGPVLMTTSSLATGTNSARVTAYGGSFTMSGSSAVGQSGGTGDVVVRARDDISVAVSSVSCQGTGNVSLTAFGGSASVEETGATTASVIRASFVGDTSISASGDVLVAGASDIRSDQGAVSLRSVTGNVSLLGDAELAAPGGAVDVRASKRFAADQDGAAFPGVYPSIDAQSLLVGAGVQGITLVCDPVTTQDGGLALYAVGDVDVASNLTANGPLAILSTAGDVQIVGRTITTGSEGDRSGDIHVASFGGSDATIDVSTSTVRSGDHATASGNVAIQIHAPAVPSSIDGAIIPAKITVKPIKGSTDQRLTASGVMDFGGDPAPLLGVAELDVGGLSFNFVLGTDSRGRGVHKTDDLTLKISPSKLGSSRGTFSLSAVGDFSGVLDEEGSGDIAIRFERGSLDVRGSATVTGGKFTLGKQRATLMEPGFRIASAHAVVKDGANDKLDVTLGVGGTEDAPSEVPDVTIAFGATYSVTVPASSFTQTSAGVLTARVPGDGVKILVLDFAEETVTFKARKVELGDFGTDPTVAVTCTLTLGADTRTYTFRIPRPGLLWGGRRPRPPPPTAC